MALYVTSYYNAEWQTLLAHPSEMLRKIDPLLWYWQWLGLDDAIPEVVRHREWSRVVYLIQHRPGVESDFEVLADSCPDIEFEGIFFGDDAEERNDVTLKRYHVWIVRCDHHRDLESERLGEPAPD